MLSIKNWNLKFWYSISNYIILNFRFEIRTVLFPTSFEALHNIVKRPRYLVVINFFSGFMHPIFCLVHGYFFLIPKGTFNMRLKRSPHATVTEKFRLPIVLRIDTLAPAAGPRTRRVGCGFKSGQKISVHLGACPDQVPSARHVLTKGLSSIINSCSVQFLSKITKLKQKKIKNSTKQNLSFMESKYSKNQS